MTTSEYRAFKDRSTRRWLIAVIAAGIGCHLLLLGPCHVGDYLERMHDQALFDVKSDIEQRMKYGDTANWDGTRPRRSYHWECGFDECYY